MPIVPALLELSESYPKANNYNNFGEENIGTRYLLRYVVWLKDAMFDKLNVRDLAAKILAQSKLHTEKNCHTTRNYPLLLWWHMMKLHV